MESNTHTYTLKNAKRVYFVGIGGIGMSALARYFVQAGLSVAGYDRTPSDITHALEQVGVDIHYEDNTALIPAEYTNPDGTLVVYTPAIAASHTELNLFRQGGYTLLKRAQVLGAISRQHKTLGVAGTHGKTSTSTMLAHILGQSAMGCDALVGGLSKNFGSNLLLANRGANLLVVEADEFDRSFLTLTPHLAVVTSTAPDHLDIYGTPEMVYEAFEQYAARIEPNGFLVKRYGLDFAPSMANGVRTLTYGMEVEADIHPSNISLHNGLYHFDLNTPQGIISNLQLGIPGLYNLENAMAAAAAALSVGIQHNELRRGLASFTGVVRRFDMRYRSNRAVYIDDYAHHPDEIRATVESLRQTFPGRAITGIFQPHLYTRTRDFAQGFAQALDRLDRAYLLDIYPAREEPIPGITAHSIANLMQRPASVLSRQELLQKLAHEPIDVLTTMGAGDIDRLVAQIANLLEQRFGTNTTTQ